MSMFLFGDIILSQNTNIIQLAEDIINHPKNHLYVKFGGNVSNQYFRTAVRKGLCLQYEITDSILDNTAECLLSPKDYDADAHFKPWQERMNNIIDFASGVLSFEVISAMTMNINICNYHEAQEHYFTCNLSNLLSVLNAVFSGTGECFEPCASLYICQS